MRLMRQDAAIHLPVNQHFDCESCTHCCRNVVVNVNEQERKRILAAGWQSRMGGQPLFIEYRFRGKRLHRLAQLPDGRCVFLRDDRLCRLHAESGPRIKPLPCRLFPFVPTPGADGIHLDLRADCPAVAANRGRPLPVHAAQIRDLIRETQICPMKTIPGWPGGRNLKPEEFRAVAAALLGCLKKSSLGYRGRLRAGCHLLDLLYQVRPEKVQGERFTTLCGTLFGAAVAQAETVLPPSNLPARAARLFREWLFLHALFDEPAYLDQGRLSRLARSWRRYRQVRRFGRGMGPVPPVAPGWPETTFEAIAAVGAAPEEALEPLCRSMAVKLEAHAFAGPGYYGYDLISGLTALWLLPALTGWFGRLAAASAGRNALTPEDLLTGLRQAHRTFGVSPAFAAVSERLRLRALAREGVPAAILAAFGP